MKERVLFRKLQTLTILELKRFLDYLVSHSGNKQLGSLGTFLQKHYRKSSWDETKLGVATFGKKQYDEMALTRLLNLANNALNKFIINELGSGDKWELQMKADLALFEFYQERMLPKLSNKLSRKIDKALSERAEQDDNYFKYQMLYHLIPRMDDHQNPEALAKQRSEKTQVIDEFYFFNKLHAEARDKNHQMSFKATGNSLFVNHIIDQLKNNDYTAKPSIVLWGRAVELLKHPENDTLFRELESQLFEHHTKQSTELNRDLFTILLNAYLKRESDKQKISSKALQYYLFQIEHNIIFFDGFFPSLMFENIITTGLKTKETKWVLEFIDEYGHRIHPDSRKGSILFAKAKCNFYDNKPNECLQELAKIKQTRFKNVYLNIVVRVLKIKAFYEVSTSDSEFDRNQPDRDINAFRKYVGNKQSELSDYYLTRFKNFANIASRLLVCNSKKKAESILSQLSDPSFIVEDKLWLTQKLESISSY